MALAIVRGKQALRNFTVLHKDIVVPLNQIRYMQPLEFLRYTPKTNCGECGYAACLAFAAAVTKGGENPGKCPYVDLSLLGDSFVGASRGSGGLSGVAGLLEEKDKVLVAYLRARVESVDLPGIAQQLGCRWSGEGGGALCFRFLGRDIVLSAKGIWADGNEIEEPRDQILLYNYVHFGGGDPLTGQWVGLESLPNSISKVRTLRVYCEERIAGQFCGNVTLLQSRVMAIGALVPEELQQGCSLAFELAVLPRLPMRVFFWDEEPEDGFAARVKVLYDQNVLTVLDMESLVFASERLAERLENNAR